MRQFVFNTAASLLLVSLSACSKEEPQAAPEASIPAQPGAAVKAPQPISTASSVNLAQLENSVGTALKQQNYDAAVDALVQAQSTVQSMNDEQRLQYAQQFRNTSTALQNASLTDPKAKAAYDRMSRAILGR
jgi:hypothetical protein